MRTGIKSRIGKLEQAHKCRVEPRIVVTVNAKARGRLTGLRVHHKIILRPANETEAVFNKRIANEQWQPGEIILVMHEIRDQA